MNISAGRIIFCIYFCSLFSPAFSQTPASAKIKKTVRVDFVHPEPVSNGAFDSLFSGVFNVNTSLNFGINNFNTGVFYNLMQCQIFPKYKSDPHSIQTTHTAGLRFGYDIYPSEEKMAAVKENYIVFSPFIAGGYTWVDYSRLLECSHPISGKHTQTYTLYTGFNLNLMFSEFDGAGITIGYNYLNHEFNPDALCLDGYYPNIPGKYKKGDTQFIFFGFNWYLDLAKRNRNSSE